MSNTTMSSSALKKYETELEMFESKIKQHCNELESNMSACAGTLSDETSKAALRRGHQVVIDILECLNPTQKILEKVRELIYELEHEENNSMSF